MIDLTLFFLFSLSVKCFASILVYTQCTIHMYLDSEYLSLFVDISGISCLKKLVPLLTDWESFSDVDIISCSFLFYKSEAPLWTCILLLPIIKQYSFVQVFLVSLLTFLSVSFSIAVNCCALWTVYPCYVHIQFTIHIYLDSEYVLFICRNFLALS